MTRLWDCCHVNVLVVSVLLFAKTVWMHVAAETETSRKLSGSWSTFTTNALGHGSVLEIVVGTTVDAETLQYYLSHWNETEDTSDTKDNTTYYGEGLQDIYFKTSAENNSQILTDMSRCLNEFQFLTCLKFLLVNRLDNLLDYIKDNNLTRTDFKFVNGVVTFKSVPGMNAYASRQMAEKGVVDLDQDITRKVMELFKDRSLRVNLLPGMGIDLIPVPGERPGDFISFKVKPYLTWSSGTSDGYSEQSEGRGRNNNKRKKNKGGFEMPNMMVLPQLIMWGFMPFALANLQAMVMNAFMLNMMALNSAIFMTIRNLVFGPRGGPKIKYVNYGYKKKSRVPTIIVHSPAAFVKQPHHKHHHHQHLHKKPFHPGPPPHVHNHHQIHPEPIYIDDSPTSYSELYKSGEPVYQDAVQSYDEHENGNIHKYENEVQVFREEGQLDGKNRVRIRIDPDKTGVKEVLHRIKAIENGVEHGEEFNTASGQQFSSPTAPWTVSHLTSHTADGNTQFKEYMVNYDDDQFRPIVGYPKNELRH